MKVEPKIIYNQNTSEKYEEAKIIGGKPNGILNINNTPHKWAVSLYKRSISRTWFPEQVNISKDKVNYSKLTIEEKKAYDLVLAQLISNDSIQANQLIDSFNKYITSPMVNACLARQAVEEVNHCVIEGTEILTSEGFKNFNDITSSTLIANWSYDGSIYWSYPKNIYKHKYTGKIVKFESEHYNQIVTPNHKVICRIPYYYINSHYKHGIEIQFIKDNAINISVHNNNLPISGYNITGYNIVFSVEDAIGVAFQADGSYVNYNITVKRHGNYISTKNGYCYQFSFKREDKIRRFNMLVKAANIRHTIKHRKNGYTVFYIWINRKYDKEFNWVTVIDKNPFWLINFIQELKYWDGCIRPNKTYIDYDNSLVYTNTNRTAIDKVIFIATVSGHQVGVYDVKLGGTNKTPCWQLHIVPNKEYKSGRNIRKSIEQYSGYVYCVENDSHNIICRYRDKVFITGNSTSYAVMAEDIVQDSSRIYNLHLLDTELHSKNENIGKMYVDLYKDSGNSVVAEDILLAIIANQILEDLVFPSGFSVFYSLEHKLPGSAEMIKEIHLDESLLHVPLFQHIYYTIIKEVFNGKVPDIVVEKGSKLLKEMMGIEIKWLTYVTKGLLGYTENSISNFIKSKGYEIAKHMLLQTEFKDIETSRDNPISNLLKIRFKGEGSSRTNFFEANASEYQKNVLVDDY